jgi:hypothetical protein
MQDPSGDLFCAVNLTMHFFVQLSWSLHSIIMQLIWSCIN